MRGRPPIKFPGRFGSFVSSFRVENLASELDIDPAAVYCWMRGDYRPKVDHAIRIIEIAKTTGTQLTLEDVLVRVVKSSDEDKKPCPNFSRSNGGRSNSKTGIR